MSNMFASLWRPSFVGQGISSALQYFTFSLLFIFRKLPHFTVVQPLKSGKDDAISQYNDIQNLR